MLPDDRLCHEIAEALVEPGYHVLDNPFPAKLLDGLLQSLLRHEQVGMKPAGIGRGKDLHQNLQIRGDNICWLTHDIYAEAAFLNWMDYLRRSLNKNLFLGLQDYESHFASYPVGAFYQKHLDAFKGNPGRKLSTVLYLNPHWDSDAGGELVLYDGASDQVLESIAPEYGRLVIFLSEQFPHEVKPARCERRSIAGWFKIHSAFPA